MRRVISIFFVGLLLISAVACKKSGTGNTGTKPPVVTNEPEAGLLTVSPYFPSDNQEVTITFDANKGNSALSGFSGDVYMHTGVITDKSTGPTNWKYVKSASFNTPDPAVKMTSLGNNKYKIVLKPRTFYGVPDDEKIQKLVMLFRTADGSTVARNSDGSDIYTPIYETTPLQVKLISPETEPMFIPKPVITVQSIGGQLIVKGVANRSANLTLSLNEVSFATASNATSVTGTATIINSGLQKLKISATESGVTAEQTLDFIINGTPEIVALPAGATKDGVNVINNGTSVILNLYAPGKNSAFVIGDFNNWQLGTNYEMKRTPDGNRWWVQINNLNPQTEYAYQYLLDGELRIADPYAEKILDQSNDVYISPSVYPNLKAYPTGKTTGIVSTFQSVETNYSWQMNSFNRPAKTDLVIYEMLLRDFVTEHSYNAAILKLDYLQELGINAIELMPVNEFEGNSSWGYNPSFYFAPDKYYGTKQALQKFIDECHKRGMAVIVDVVLNHSFGQSPMVQMYWDKANNRPAANSPWYNVSDKHPFGVGYDFNHESAATKYFSKNVMKFWLQEYKVDGFRFDLSKGFTQNFTGTDVNAMGQYDQSRVNIWKEYNTFIKGVDPSAYVILEHFAVEAEEKVLAAEGMMLWNNINYNYNEATMGFLNNSNFQYSFSDKHSFPVNDRDKLVTYMESHDEERLMYKNLQFGNSTNPSHDVKSLAVALKRQEMAAAFLMATPGPKMIWQFGELGYDYSINTCTNGTVSNDCRLSEKPIKWDYNTGSRKALYNAMAKMIKLKINQSVFETSNFSYSLSGAIKFIKLQGGNMNLVVVGNFDVNSQTANFAFPNEGTWYDYMSPGQTQSVSGNYTKTLAPGEYHIYTSIDLN